MEGTTDAYVHAMARTLGLCDCLGAGSQCWIAQVGGEPPFVASSFSPIARAHTLQEYCSPKTNYADVRKRVANAFSEKANEMADAIAAVQKLSKEATRLVGDINAQCA